ncbi:CD48 antigen-like [Danio rerio]|uniref:CD48 antigen-like n=1 Tax=Danio rerio TaxID=7955 RepID=A0AC58HYH9_DANRE
MGINHFVLFLLIFKTGFSAEISVFVLTGDSVELDIQTKLPEFEELTWIYNKLESIVKYYIKFNIVNSYPAYNNRAILNKTTFSLILENMQKKDSGLYTARIYGQIINDIVTYRVSVLDEVEAPVLTVKSNGSSSKLCSFTCSGQDITMSSIYNSSNCPEEEETSADDHTLRLNCNSTFITCNYSNPVSWKTDIKKVHELCTVKLKLHTYCMRSD